MASHRIARPGREPVIIRRSHWALILSLDGGIDGVNKFVEILSGDSGTFLGDLGLPAPLGFAFAA